MRAARRGVGARRPVAFTAAARVEQDPGNSEDAPPLVVSRPGGLAVGVFDGMGGAGASRHVDAEGRDRTEAYIAARVCWGVAADVLHSSRPPHEERDALERALTCALKRLSAEAVAGTGALRSRLIRRFPTTAAMALVTPYSGGMTVHAIWAGDSRVYVILPEQGLVQVSRDDVRGNGDALEMILSDPPLTRCLSAEEPVVLSEHQVDVAGGAVVLAATDGCFAYLPSPWHFEHLVLSCLQDSGSAEDLSASLRTALAIRAQDDATIALAVVGFDNLATAARAFGPRQRMVARHLIAPLEAGDARIRFAEAALAAADEQHAAAIAERAGLLAQLWTRYRIDYEHILPDRDEEDEDAEGR